jgi:hypothetical protein
MSAAPKGVVWDVGNVIYPKIFPASAERDGFIVRARAV